MNPTIELLQAMAECGLSPKDIVWDGNFHRFPGIDQQKGDNGYYKAFADQRNAIFGDNRTKEMWKWPQDKDIWREKMSHVKRLSADEVRKRKAKADRERVEESKVDTERILNLWTKAKECRNHPYLGAKGIKDVPLLRSIIDPKTEQEMLLIPMRNKDAEIRNIQRIWPDGTRKQMRQAGGSKGLYCTIGADRYMSSKTLYLCEGWATGHSISLASNCAVIVAFFDGGLLTVGKIIQEKYPKARLVIAADNDRWKPVPRDGGMVNPGVWAAKRAAKELNAEYCIPEFPDLATKPTDFDDLRQMTDLAVVREWLNPAKAGEAVTMAESEAPSEDEADDEAEASPDETDEDAHWSESFPSQFLGSQADTYFFLSERSGQVLHFGAFRKTDMLKLAPLSWYEDHFGTRTKRGIVVRWDEAIDAVIDRASYAGTYDPDKVRGRGAWEDTDHKLLLHLGDRLLLPDGKEVAPHTYRKGNRVYPRRPPLLGSTGNKPMEVGTSKKLLNLFEAFDWEEPSSGTLLAGWCVLAPFCGALRWRPHVWLTGPTSCGKSTIIHKLVRPLTAGMEVAREGLTSEAAIRQHLGGDALPVIIDEFEQQNKNAESKVQGLLQLARSAAGGGIVSKGTPGGKEMRYQIRSMFMFSSTVVGLRQQADRNRTAILALKFPQTRPSQRKQTWHSLRQDIDKQFNVTAGARLVARTHKWIRDGRFDQLRERMFEAVHTVLEDARGADLYGALLAGAYTLKEDDPPERSDDLLDWVKDMGLKSHMPDPTHDGLAIIDLLFQTEVSVDHKKKGTRRITIGQMVEIVVSCIPVDQALREMADNALKQRGLRVYPANHDEDIKEKSLFVANTSSWVKEVLRNTNYRDGWQRQLRTITKAASSQKQRYVSASLMRARGTLIPISSLPSRVPMNDATSHDLRLFEWEAQP